MEETGWNILDTGPRGAQENMQLDKDLLDSLDPHACPLLHFYQWEGNAATYGYFVKPQDFLHMEACAKENLELARRPTGGGIVLHAWDLAFSVLIPQKHPFFSENTLENYAFIHRIVLGAIEEFMGCDDLITLIGEDAYKPDEASTRFCMARPTKYDLVVGQRKIAGAAQRKTKQGFLHQGTIALKVPPADFLEKILLPNTQVLKAMLASTFPLLKDKDNLELERERLKNLLQTHFTKVAPHVTKT